MATSVRQTSIYCQHCECQRLFTAHVKQVNHILHLLISLFCCFLWPAVWFVLSISDPAPSWRCNFCGSAPVYVTGPIRPIQNQSGKVRSGKQSSNHGLHVILMILAFALGMILLVMSAGFLMKKQVDIEDPPVRASGDQSQRKERPELKTAKSDDGDLPDLVEWRRRPALAPVQEPRNERERLDDDARRAELERQKELYFKLVESRFRADEESRLAGKGMGDPLVRANAAARAWRLSWERAAQKLGLTVEEANRLLQMGRSKSWPSPSEAADSNERLPGDQIPTGKPAAKTESKPTAGEERFFEITPGTKMKFCWIPDGEAQLGSRRLAQDRIIRLFFDGKRPQHLDIETEQTRGKFKSAGFWLGKYEVTQEEWQAVMRARPSKFRGLRLPVEQVSCEDCNLFVEKCHLTGFSMRLPTEDEWEYACRGGNGNQREFYLGDELDIDKANFRGSASFETAKKGGSKMVTSEVGSYEKRSPHPWGLCDMHGNVAEWCENRQVLGGLSFSIRGGSWDSSSVYCRSAYRGMALPTYKSATIGFRLVLMPKE